MDDKGLTTFFKYKLFTIPKETHKEWNYTAINEKGLEAKFKFCVSNEILDQYKNQDTAVYSILTEMVEQDAYLTIKNNKGQRYDENDQYIKCSVPEILLPYIKKLFVSTLVFKAENCEIPSPEIIEFEFDTTTASVNISKLLLYQPKENPYYKYAQNSVASLSVEAIGLGQYSIDKSGAVKDFYNFKQMSKWKEAKELKKENLIGDKAGIYMLYNINLNTFYVGKAIKLKERILQHQKNISGNDPIPEFTHYRYSVISGEYYEFLYLIENAAIHDCAWIIDMPNAQNISPSLTKKIKEKSVGLNECKMVNTLEHQTRKQ